MNQFQHCGVRGECFGTGGTAGEEEDVEGGWVDGRDAGVVGEEADVAGEAGGGLG